MRTEELLEQCLQALSTGQELPLDLAHYLARHPEQRAQVEDLLFVAQRASHLPAAELPAPARDRMQNRLAARLSIDPTVFTAPAGTELEAAATPEQSSEYLPYSSNAGRKKLRLSTARLALARIRYSNSEPPRDSASEACVRAVFRDLSQDDIRRYIGVRGEDYLYYRQRMPGWEPVLAVIAFVLRGFKRIEKLVVVNIDQ